jgi:hypothetical protein
VLRELMAQLGIDETDLDPSYPPRLSPPETPTRSSFSGTGRPLPRSPSGPPP